MADALWAPWRMDYIKSVADGPAECFLCAAAKALERDETNLVIARSGNCLLMMNRYPYVNGHLMAATYRHEGELGLLTMQERSELMELTVHAQALLMRAMNPQGFNVGMNLGKCAGAGVPGHVHVHIVPRWSGDVNFMSVVGQVRIIPQALEEAFGMLRAANQTIRKGS